MEISAPPPPDSDRYRRVAAPLHTILVLAAVGFWAFRGAIRADQLRAAVNLSRAGLYERTMLFEWLMFAFIILGVKLNGSSLLTVLGDRWRSALQVLRDVGIAVVFLLSSAIVVSTFGHLLGVTSTQRNVQFLLPHGGREITLWIALSITAGICEETIFRGYLQRQFVALTKNASLGILLSAMAFGGAHAYQGFRQAVSISLLGALLGILAHWRRSVRPGMISHALQDILGGLFAGAIRH